MNCRQKSIQIVTLDPKVMLNHKLHLLINKMIIY